MNFPKKYNNPGYYITAINDDGNLNTLDYFPEGDAENNTISFAPLKGYVQDCWATVGAFQVSFSNSGSYFNVYPPDEAPERNVKLTWKSSELAKLESWIPDANPAKYFPVGWSVILADKSDKVYTHEPN